MKQTFIFSTLTISLLGILLFTNTTSCNNATNEQEKQDTLETLLPDTHNANNALDWAGTYKGILPCADCEGIAVVLDINQDNTFKKSSTYKNKSNTSFIDSGRIFWDSTGSIISLQGSVEEKYKVEENRLRMLDKEGKEVAGTLATHYILKKK